MILLIQTNFVKNRNLVATLSFLMVLVAICDRSFIKILGVEGEVLFIESWKHSSYCKEYGKFIWVGKMTLHDDDNKVYGQARRRI